MANHYNKLISRNIIKLRSSQLNWTIWLTVFAYNAIGKPFQGQSADLF